MRKCTKCGELKTALAFYTTSTWCKKCMKAHHRKRYVGRIPKSKRV